MLGRAQARKQDLWTRDKSAVNRTEEPSTSWFPFMIFVDTDLISRAGSRGLPGPLAPSWIRPQPNFPTPSPIISSQPIQPHTLYFSHAKLPTGPQICYIFELAPSTHLPYLASSGSPSKTPLQCNFPPGHLPTWSRASGIFCSSIVPDTCFDCGNLLKWNY